MGTTPSTHCASSRERRERINILDELLIGLMVGVIEIDVFPRVQVDLNSTSSMRAPFTTRTLDELYENSV